MSRHGWSAFVVVMALAAGNWDACPSRLAPDHAPLQGAWVITSAHKNGERDLNPVNGIVTFVGDTVQFDAVAAAFETASIPDGTG